MEEMKLPPDYKPKVELPKKYKPSEKEDFMNENQLEYFRQKLIAWKYEIEQDIQEAMENLKNDTENSDANSPDEIDRAAEEETKRSELRIKDRERKLIKKIESALKRIEDGTYGYCVITGEKIDLKRLEARPVAKMTLEAQEDHEAEEKKYFDDHN